MDPLINKDNSTSNSFKEQSSIETFLSRTKIKKGSKKQVDSKNDESQSIKERNQSAKEKRALIWKRTKFATLRMTSGGLGRDSAAATVRSMDSGTSSRRGGSGKSGVFGTVLSAVSMKRKAQLNRMKSSTSLTDKLSTTHGEKQYCNMEDSPIYILRVCAFGNVEKAESMLKENIKLLKVEDNKGFTCMHQAVSKNQLTTIDLLLNYGADINVLNSLTGDTPLHMAVEKNCIKSVKHLLTKPDLDTTILNKKGYAPIHLAVVLNKPAILEEFLQSDKVDNELPGIHDKMAVHWAAMTNQDKCMQLLMKYNCRLCITCGFGYYPTHLAAKAASWKTLRVMLENAHNMNFGYTKEFLLNLTDKEQATPLHLAVNSGDPETVRTCLENGAKVDVIQESKATALHYASSQGSLTIVTILYDAFLQHQRQQQGVSGDENGDPDAEKNLGSFVLELKDILNMTALHRAAMYDHEPVVSFLIGKGANIESVDSQKRTPLLVSAVRGGSKSFFTLISAGVNEQVEDVINRCVLHYLVMHWCTIDAQVTDYLDKVSKSQDGRKLLNKKDHWGYTPLHMAARDDNVKFTDALIGLGVVINLKDNEDRTSLHHTAKYGCFRAAKLLLDSLAGQTIINETDLEGMTALHVACQYGHTKIVQLLLRKGAMAHRDQSNRTPLHLATQHGYADVIQVLLSIHRNLLDIKAKTGDTPLHYAAEYNQPICAQYLLSANCKYRLNDEFKSPLDSAIDSQNVAVALAMVQHERWNEILNTYDTRTGWPIYRLIEHIPEVYKVILDRSFTTSETEQHISKVSPDYWERYNYQYLDLNVDQGAEDDKDFTKIKPLGSLNMMVTCGRVQLLMHPVCLAYLNTKWIDYGLFVFAFNIIMYATFLASLNDSVLLWHYRLTSYRNLNKHTNLTTVSLDDIYSMTASSNKDKMRYNTLHQLAMIYITLYSSACSLKELLKLIVQPKAYLTDFTSYLGTGLFLSALRFSILAFSPSYKSDILFEFQCGCISLFFAWLNLLLFMQRLDSIGLYIVMFRQILKTILKVWVSFFVLFVAFGLTFYLLLTTQEKVDFRLPFIAVFQSILMMMGDWNFVENFAKPYYYNTLVYPHLTYGFLLTFVILMPILFINLLIGLAVGDIEIVQKDASLKRLAMQVQYHTELENRMPNRLLRRFQKKELIKYPNGNGTGKGKLQLLRTLIKRHLFSEDKRTGDNAPGQNQDENDRIMQEMNKTKTSMNEMKQKIDRMSDLLQTLIGRMGIEMDEEELRIAENRRHSNASLMQAQ